MSARTLSELSAELCRQAERRGMTACVSSRGEVSVVHVGAAQTLCAAHAAARRPDGRWDVAWDGGVVTTAVHLVEVEHQHLRGGA